MPPTNRLAGLQARTTNMTAANPGESRAFGDSGRGRGRRVGVVVLASTLVMSVLGCPTPASPDPGPKAPPLPMAQPEAERCAGDAGSATGDCLPEGCLEAFGVDAAAEDLPEPNCAELLAP